MGAAIPTANIPNILSSTKSKVIIAIRLGVRPSACLSAPPLFPIFTSGVKIKGEGIPYKLQWRHDERNGV